MTERLFRALARSKVITMEEAYWLGRKRASLKLAKGAVSSQARLIHYELAGRYSVKAVTADTQAINLAAALPPSIHADRAYQVSPDLDDA